MKSYCLFPVRVGRWLVVAASLALTGMASAQITNWVAYNDHRPSTTPVLNGWPITAPRVGTLDMGAPADTTGNLINFLTGDALGATVTFTRANAPDDFGTVVRPLPTNTPAARIFYGICDIANDGIVGVDAVDGDFVTITFANLNPAKRYIFRGTGNRNGGYAARWTVATITNVGGFINAHLNGTGPGVITSNEFPANLGAGQAAYNSGHNAQGAVVGWDDIAPLPDGTFQIIQQQYVGPTPNGGQALDANYGYAFGAMLLAEVESVAPTITAHPQATTTVEQNRPFSLSVAATGTPLLYQWYKQGSGAVPGATFSTFTVPLAAVSDSGNYYAVVYNSLARETSTVAQVTVFADTTAPTVEAIFSYPNVDANGVATLDQIIIEFNESVTPASVGSASQYTVPGGGNPASVVVTNGRSVVLMLSAPLAEDTAYSVTLSGATDLVGNVAGSSSAPFRSWTSGLGNGLLMESYDVAGTDLTVESLLASPNYPNNPFRRDTLRTFDSRLVFPDDAREGYGARISGVFIPPVSGTWLFYFRTRNLGVVNFNPNGTDPAGKIEILRQSTENSPYNWDKFTSPALSLRAGRAYYIEGLYKGATGPDYIKVAARLAGTGFPTPVDTADTTVDPNSLSGAAIAFPLAPRDLGGPLTIQQDLVNLTTEENNLATFSLQLNNPSLLPLQYQWFRGGSPIPGANGPTYTIQPTIAADNGATFSVQVAKVGSVVTSRTATLTVVPDVTRPRVVEVISNPTNLTSLTVRFSELIVPSQAIDSFSYNLGPIGIADPAVLEPDGSTVTLTLTTPMTLGESYQLTVSGINDLTGVNLINPNPTIITVVAGGELPRLRIALSGSNAELSWPAPSAGFVLEQASAIVEPVSSIVWTPVGGTPQVVNGRNTLSVAAGPGTKIFRLRQ